MKNINNERNGKEKKEKEKQRRGKENKKEEEEESKEKPKKKERNYCRSPFSLVPISQSFVRVLIRYFEDTTKADSSSDCSWESCAIVFSSSRG